MNREFKVGDLVIYIDKYYSDCWKRHRGTSIYGKLARIVYINKYDIKPYLVEFKEFINSIPKEKGKDGHCWRCGKDEFKLAINHYKFKKWIKG